MLGFVSAVILVSLSAAYSKETKEEDVVLTRDGATVHLNCSGMCSVGQWRGPIENSLEEHTVYFQGSKKNHKLNVTNLCLDEDKASKKYNLIIFNLTYKNVGVYICQCLPNSATDPGFKIHRFRVLLNSSEDVNRTTSDSTNENMIQKITQQPSNPVPVIAVTGVFFVLVVVAMVLARKHYSRILFDKWNIVVAFFSQYRAEQSERTEDNEPEQSTAVQNRLYESTQLNVNLRQQTVQFASTDPVQTSTTEDQPSLTQAHAIGHEENKNTSNTSLPANDQNTDEDNNANGGRFQISEAGLKYSVVLHEPGRPGQFSKIRGLANKTIYSDIDHTLTAMKLPEESEGDSDE